MAQTHQKEEFYNGVSTLDEPSAKWGWHDLGKGAMQKAGWVSVLFIFGMLIGNHHGHVEDLWLIGIGVVLIIGLLLHAFPLRGHQVHTVTAHNKPQGHVEPNWCADQAAGTGVYAELTDRQARAWNRIIAHPANEAEAITAAEPQA
ncbi:DUF2631 domain-containing protein [Corynebacterium sphenisci]|uniref:DUF2631 domain-containing protein n=1 Tax=Corynebacterium sphenisci TaxID=191493 RepID=UPI0026DFB059|nr:DUF2631 domain-containing protein [Corynebacterium sphenisci]MDO5731351.1 DUF2631 domain-containing protein [Corynebacterium sphenisci]